jgi:hypothetical protein
MSAVTGRGRGEGPLSESDATLDALWHETLDRSPVAATLGRPVPLTIERRSH